QPVPRAPAQALRSDQVELAVDPREGRARRGDLVTGEVLELLEHLAHTVELPGDRVGALVDPAAQRLGLSLQLEVPLGPTGVVLALLAAVARVGTDGRPEAPDGRVVLSRAGVTGSTFRLQVAGAL